jgi:hypothetical protein
LIQATALLATLAIEGIGMGLLALALPSWRPHWRRAVGLCLALNLASHTLFWLALPHVPLRGPEAVALGETVVILGEGAVYALTVAFPRWTGWPVSLALNWASWVLSGYLWR